MSDSKKKKRAAFLLIVLFLPACIFGSDKKTGLNYFTQAELLYKTGNYIESGKLLALGYEFYPDFSEITYLLSMIHLKNQQTTLSGLSWLKKAVADNTWTKTDPYSALRELGRVYLQVKEYKKAIEIFLGMEQRLKEEPESAYLMARALKENNETKKLENFLADTHRRFPSFDKLSILYAGFLNSNGRKKTALQILDQGLEKDPDNLSLLLEKIKLIGLSEEGKKLLSDYFEKGGTSPDACFLALSFGLPDSDTYAKMFFAHNGNSDIQLLDRFIALSEENPHLVPYYEEDVSGYSGNRTLDVNGDGFFEELYVYENGSLISWFSDKNQDGAPETEISFKEEIPWSVKFALPENAAVIAAYSTYPYAASVLYDSVSGDNSRIAKEYQLLPLVYSFSLFKKSPEKDAKKKRLGIPGSYKPPLEKDMLKIACRMTESINGREMKIVELSGGETVSVSIDTDMDGVRDHIITYKNRIRVSGRRDLDNDGNFEILEFYKNNLLEKTTFDYNNDGKPDCTQFYSAAGEMTETDWDYDFNGTIDAREIPGKKDTLVFLFSTKYNGIFDLRFVFDSGKLIDAKRGGQSLRIIPWTGRGIYWIGKKGEEFLLEHPGLNGVYMVKGKAYFMFRYREDVYIEELL